MDNKSHAQHGEDLHISKLISPDASRYGVDVGANDGHSWSNSYKFGLDDYNLLLIEPMPIYAQRCRDLYEGNDKVVIEEVAVSPTEGTATFFVSDSDQDQLAMRSSLARDLVPSDTVTAIKVRTAPLHCLLVQHNWPRHYAFLSVDAEGFDLDVLKTAQLERYRPSVICVEEGEHHDEIKRYLGGWGYRYDVTLGPNSIYVQMM
jgi:FkbM family methyltransferase